MVIRASPPASVVARRRVNPSAPYTSPKEKTCYSEFLGKSVSLVGGISAARSGPWSSSAFTASRHGSRADGDSPLPSQPKTPNQPPSVAQPSPQLPPPSLQHEPHQPPRRAHSYSLKPATRALLAKRREEQVVRRKEQLEKQQQRPLQQQGKDLQQQQQQQGGAPGQTCLPTSGEAPKADGSGDETFFRFWHDEKLFKGRGADCLVRAALAAAGGQRAGGHAKEHPERGPLGWQRLGRWEVLWSPASTAMQAAEQGPSHRQLLSAVPGTRSLSGKQNLAETLTKAYGPAGAACLMPLTFRLPGQLREWRRWMAANPCGAAPGADSGQEQGEGEGQRLWMLKTAEHLGKGLQLVAQEAALAAVLQRQADVLSYKTETEETGRNIAGVGATSDSSSDGGGGSCSSSSSSGGGGLPSRGKRDPDRPRPFVLAQRYVEDPLLIGGRKFGIRVWVVMLSGTVAPAATGAGAAAAAAAAGGGGAGVEARAGGVGLSAKEAEAEGHEAQEPLRVYLHENGLVLFATEAYEGGSSEVGSGGAGSEGGEDVDGLGEGTLPHPVAAAASASPAAVIVEQGGDDGEEWVEGEDEEQGEEDDDDDEAEEEAEDTYTPTAMQRLGLATAAPPSPSPRSSTPSPSTSASSTRRCEVPLGHVTNYAQNVDGMVWGLEQLGEHLGQERFGLLIRRLRRSAALTLAAALPHVRSETARLRRRGVRSGWPLGAEEAGGCSGGCGAAAAGADGGTNARGGCFELLGLDYLVDSNMRPWLLEVNSTPSLAVQHSDPRVRQLIAQQKEGMVVDMVGGLLQLGRRYGGGVTAGSSGGHQVASTEAAEEERVRETLQALYPQVFYQPHLLQQLAAAEAELRNRGGFLPLMPLFPTPTQTATMPVPSSVRVAPPPQQLADSDDDSARSQHAATATEQQFISEPDGYILDAPSLPPGFGQGLPWNEADLLLQAWCSDRERLEGKVGKECVA